MAVQVGATPGPHVDTPLPCLATRPSAGAPVGQIRKPEARALALIRTERAGPSPSVLGRSLVGRPIRHPARGQTHWLSTTNEYSRM